MSDLNKYTNVETFLVARSLEQSNEYRLFSALFFGLEKRLLSEQIEDWVRGSGSAILRSSQYALHSFSGLKAETEKARDLLKQDALEHTKESSGVWQLAETIKYRAMSESPANRNLSAVGALLSYALLDLDYKEISFYLLRGLPHPVEKKTYADLAEERLKEVYWVDIAEEVEF